MADIEVALDAFYPTADSSVTVTVHEDTDQDGTAENTGQAVFTDGTTRQTISGFTGGTGNDYWVSTSADTNITETSVVIDAVQVDTEPDSDVTQWTEHDFGASQDRTGVRSGIGLGGSNNLKRQYRGDFDNDSLTKGLQFWAPLHDSGDPVDLTKNTSPTNNGATDSVYGIGGLTAYSFDGSNDGIDAGTPSILQDISSDNVYTVSLWARPESIGTSSGVQSLWGNYSNDGTSIRFNDDLFTAYIRDSSGNVDSVQSSPLSNYQWYHLVAVRDGSGSSGWTLYVDGLPDTTTSADQGSSGVSGDGNITIGKFSKEDSRYFDGSIADVRVYDRALSSDEVTALYERGSGDYTTTSLHDGSDSGAVSRWTFDSDPNDSWGSNDGTLNADASVGNSDAVYGGSANFTGSDGDYINGSLQNVDDSVLTISAWIHPNDGGDAVYPIISHDSTDPYDEYAIRYAESDENVNMRLDNDGNSLDISSNIGSTKPSTWSHACFTWDGSIARVYVNGTFQNSVSGSPSFNMDSYRIGDYFTNSNGHFTFDGNIDDVRIYDRALSQAEVFELYQEKHGIDQRGDLIYE